MINIFIAFITGLTTGGLSCLAMQGGLLASSLAQQIEKDLQAAQQGTTKKSALSSIRSPKIALPILVFLAAKLLAYTILGFLLGMVGSMFQLSIYTRAFLQIAIGVFMLGSALRMLNVHPIFRVFAFEPPAFLRRRIRKTASGAGASFITPALLGVLTVLIPCGVTQAMMAMALSSASPVTGAALMFAFTLGTSPVFFGIAYFTTRLGAKLEKHFMRFVAVVVLLLAFVTIDSGITLAGSRISLTRTFTRVLNTSSEQVAATARPKPTAVPEETQDPNYGPHVHIHSPRPPEPTAAPTIPAGGELSTITIEIKNNGYEPGVIHAKAGVPLKIRLISKNVFSCSLGFVIPSLGIQQILGPTDEALVEVPPQEKGTQLPFTCAEGMFAGDIVFDL